MAVEARQDIGDTDEGPRAAPHAGVERTCVVTRRISHPDALIRFVLGPENAVVADLKRKLPGRGVWVGLSKVLVAQAIRKQAFSRALKEKVVASPDLPELIEKLLRRDALQALSMANKVGLVTTGYAKVESAINSGAVCALIHASDGAPDGKRKLGQVLRRKFGEASRPEIGAFTVDELDSALGRGNVVHAALAPGSAAKVFLASSRRLAVYRGDEEAEASSGEAVLTKSLTTNMALEQDFNADGTNGQGPGTYERYE
ncbi:RNA-binding protein [uncultured Rhodoblastus sp.]|uniref:RNA-binding protein n=1 Tax=uncultured Rhodoblastus sp. TaxID=543037 RepID=UPI0025FC4E4F|nr:RNA-binding protein [uncultured Rhodoblastus sp.]